LLLVCINGFWGNGCFFLYNSAYKYVWKLLLLQQQYSVSVGLQDFQGYYEKYKYSHLHEHQANEYRYYTVSVGNADIQHGVLQKRILSET